MFPTWRLQLRTARQALADGRWDEAAQLLASPLLREFLPARQLSQQQARQLVDRARSRIDAGQSQASWQDLRQASQLCASEADLDQVRRRQAEARLAGVAVFLARGEPAAAAAELERMQQRRLAGAEGRTWQDVVDHIRRAEQQAARGDLAAAAEGFEHALRLIPTGASAEVRRRLGEQSQRVRERVGRLAELDARLHEAIAAVDWTRVLATAQAVLELAPEHSAARQARRRAWQAVGLDVTQALPAAKAPRPRLAPLAASTHAPLRGSRTDTVTERKAGKRLLAWIDAVGGFLVCLGDEIVLGQPVSDGSVDVPLLADVSRRHAIIRREGESYVLVPLQTTHVDGQLVGQAAVLRDKSTIRLGEAVELRFRKPHSLSNTAVLEVLSHHKTEPAVDGVVLMSDSCILGPQTHSHIRCRDWTADLVLFRRGSELMARAHAPLEVDGQTRVGPTPLGGNCRIEAEEYALSLEEI